MDHLGTLNAFLRSAETGSFVAAGRQLGLSASAIGKAIARLEQRLGVRLFHRNTRNMALTEEGSLFLDRCRRIFEEVEAAEAELAQARQVPKGRLRVSLPLVGMLLMPVIADFMRAYPDIRLDLDFTDRLVDVIEEGFDAVIRTGPSADSRLMNRMLGRFALQIVASPAYLEERGVPAAPQDLVAHACLHQRSPATGKLRPWPLTENGTTVKLDLPETMSANTIEPLIHLAEQGFGIACLPPFAVARQIELGALVPLLEAHIAETGMFSVLWPANRQLSPKIRAFVSFLGDHLFVRQKP